jgi:hypothetical protein
LFVTVRDALKQLHHQSQQFRTYQRTLKGKRRAIIRAGGVPLFKGKSDLQMTAFSDCYVLSEVYPAWHVLAAVQALGATFLQKGILTRGGIAHGQAHHKQGVLFGPAIIEAYDLEHEVARYPRILVSDAVRREIWGYHNGLCKGQLLKQDVDGCWFVNVLVPPLSNWTALTGSASERSLRGYMTSIRGSLIRQLQSAEGHAGHRSKVEWLVHKFNESANAAGIDPIDSAAPKPPPNNDSQRRRE